MRAALRGLSAEHDDRPVSVRLGQVVPPEDPEDWGRPLTWVAALGMLAAPLSALIWFLAAPPDDAARSYAATWLLAAVLVAGAVATGLTQRGHWRAGAGTLGAALFAAVATVALGFTFSPEPAGIDPPAIALTHAATASMAGVIGAAAAAPVVGVTSGHRSRIRIGLAAAGLGAATAVLMVELLMPPT